MYEIFEKLLRERGVTAYKVAKDTGIGTATLSNWKNGKYTPKQDKMQKLADYFGVSIDYLMTGKESNDENTSTEKDYAKNETERKLLVLCRKANDVSEEEREDIINLFENTIDLYLKAKGIKGDE
ncbi:helix-turn-helix transcriptional regulator [Eubacterium sp. BL-380-WT-2B]|uniref:helix-turn-helix domain-containing protein n=1 Tax=Eubacterium sp. BL-380-WT-2B TaxID=2605785 RepID=UPI0012B3BA1A|nr:helix-turn-helix transcriptional regulator [Eubacterium sp. BL-380-WT-2B]MSS94137.1 helix-turn-helix transcriptional regulator [Eubacterium sp. BL-380-WT-2B]